MFSKYISKNISEVTTYKFAGSLTWRVDMLCVYPSRFTPREFLLLLVFTSFNNNNPPCWWGKCALRGMHAC